MSYEERLRILGLSALEEAVKRAHCSLQLSEEGKRREMLGFAPGYQWQDVLARFRLNIRKHFFILRVIKLRNKVPKEVLVAPYLSALRCLNSAFSDRL